MTEKKLIRLNRYLSIAGAASRRKADTLISGGRVSVNGRLVTDLGTKIDPVNDSVFLDGTQVADLDPKVYILLNKPRDCITTLSDEKGRPTVLDYVKTARRVFPVGRLDRNTTGVLIFTNDGDFAQSLMHPGNELVKTYLVTVDRPLTEAVLRKLATGVRLSDGMTRPADVALVPGGKSHVVGISIHEGRNRQIHRMFRSVEYVVEKLERVGYGPLTTEGLPRGKWRYLTTKEIELLKKSTATDPRSTGDGPKFRTGRKSRVKGRTGGEGGRASRAGGNSPVKTGKAAAKGLKRGLRGTRPDNNNPRGKTKSGPKSGRRGAGRI